jgi:purine-nucleoside phosphorylase
MTPHISAKKGEIAETILLPGDPLRAKFIAENFLENPVQFNAIPERSLPLIEVGDEFRQKLD